MGIARSIGVGAAAVGAGAAVRHGTHTWGATADECRERLLGDELVDDPALTATRAVTIDAPAAEVWSWLVQIGQDRGGMYSYDRLENLIGLGIHSTDEIRPEWQTLAVGDRVVLVPKGWAGTAAGYELPVAVVEPPHTLVLRQSPPEHPWDAVWSFHLRDLPDGRTRLISRSRSRRRPLPGGAIDLVLDVVMDPVTWFMTRKMLLGIKARAERASNPTPIDLVREEELEGLPAPAQRYLRFMGVPGSPRTSWFRARFRGEIRMRPDQAWMPYVARQCNRIDPVTRVARMRLRLAGVVPMFGRDTYVDHRGRMVGKVLGLVRVADGAGPEFDASELVTFLNDAVMLAPSMLLTPASRWRPVDDTTFEVDLTDAGTTVTARVVVDDDGRPIDFSTEDRWYAGTDPPTRARWSTPFEGWTVRPDGRPLPTRGAAVWHLPDGDFTYARGSFVPADLTEGT